MSEQNPTPPPPGTPPPETSDQPLTETPTSTQTETSNQPLTETPTSTRTETPGPASKAQPLEVLHPCMTIDRYPVQLLEGQRIALGLTGSIASVKGVELARELARHGARVLALMSPASIRILGPQAMEFATGRPVVTEIGGQVEHVTLAQPGGCQGYLIAPCTATTLGRIVHGLGDTPVALAALSLLGTSTPVILAPAMDGSMADNPVVRENLDRARTLGCRLIPPVGREGKAKLSEVRTITAWVCRHCGPRDWRGRRVLVVAGASSEPVDGVRVLTNRSSGRTGISLAEALFARGAEVELWYGDSPASVPEHLETRRFSSILELQEMVTRVGQEDPGRPILARERATTGNWDWVFVPAALADFVIDRPFEYKFDSSGSPPALDLVAAPRLLELLRPLTDKLVGFKLELGVTPRELERRAAGRLAPEGPCDMVVANLALDALDRPDSQVLVLGGKERKVLARIQGPKMTVAHGILDVVLSTP